MTILWNDREEGRFVCHILDTKTGVRGTVPKPSYSVSPENRVYLFQDRTRNVEIVGDRVMPINGHNTYLPIGDSPQWILNDTYPDRTRRQTPYLYHIPTGRRVDLGHFYLPPEYQGEWRCDLHPRSSRDGRSVTIDSPHGSRGRQVWLLDVSRIVAGRACH